MRKLILGLFTIAAMAVTYVSLTTSAAKAQYSTTPAYKTFGCWTETTCQTSVGRFFNDADMCWANNYHVRVFHSEEDYRDNRYECR